MTPLRTKSLLVGATAPLILLVGCTGEPGNTAQTGAPPASSAPASAPLSPTASNSTSPSASNSTSPSAGGSPSASTTASGASNEALLKAAKTAEAAVSGAKVTSIESQQNGAAWDVTVTAADGTESELTVAGDGASVTKAPRAERDSAGDKSDNARELKGAKLSYGAAVDKLEDTVANGIVRELSLDYEAAKSVWEASVADGSVVRDITLDASTGAVLTNKVDD